MFLYHIECSDSIAKALVQALGSQNLLGLAVTGMTCEGLSYLCRPVAMCRVRGERSNSHNINREGKPYLDWRYVESE
jgi:hypothetical protein